MLRRVVPGEPSEPVMCGLRAEMTGEAMGKPGGEAVQVEGKGLRHQREWKVLETGRDECRSREEAWCDVSLGDSHGQGPGLGVRGFDFHFR